MPRRGSLATGFQGSEQQVVRAQQPAASARAPRGEAAPGAGELAPRAGCSSQPAGRGQHGPPSRRRPSQGLPRPPPPSPAARSAPRAAGGRARPLPEPRGGSGGGGGGAETSPRSWRHRGECGARAGRARVGEAGGGLPPRPPARAPRTRRPWADAAAGPGGGGAPGAVAPVGSLPAAAGQRPGRPEGQRRGRGAPWPEGRPSRV